MSSSSHKFPPPQEPRSWDKPEELDRLIDELRDQIEGLRARIEDYRNVISGEDPDRPPPRQDA